MGSSRRAWFVAVALGGLVACGGGVHDDVLDGGIGASGWEVGQTHLIAPDGRGWSLTDTGGEVIEARLHLVGRRDALVLVALDGAGAARPDLTLEGWLGAVRLGAVPLQPPAALPPTEDGGAPYAPDRFSALAPAAWIQPGLALRAASSDGAFSASVPVEVGADVDMALRVLPFYVFGADEGVAGAPGLAVSGAPDAARIAEVFARWPIATLEVANHDARKVVWPALVIGPRADRDGTAQAAYVARSASEYKDGFAGMSAVLSALHALRAANGEGPLAVQYYAPIIGLDAGGAYASPGGGLGGGSAGVGDYAYAGIFIHEQGHAFGLPHAGSAFDAGRYPYEWGSLAGSAWGYDAIHGRLLPPWIPPSAETYATCATDTFGGHPRTLDSDGRCVKQDPMQSGSGDQSSADTFAMFSDFNTAVMQGYFEGTTSIDATSGAHVYDGGKLTVDPNLPGRFRRWDGLDRAWLPVTPTTTSNGLYGLEQGLPSQVGVPVHAVVITISHAATAGATQIYPAISYTGNLRRTIDPTSAADRADILPDTGTYPWFCRNGGCDYTLRVTYADASQRHVLLQGGFRPFNQPMGTPPASATDPLDSDSFETFAVTVPGDQAITRLELLSTPMVWAGMPATPTVLATR